MSNRALLFTTGSPFSRIVRVVLDELDQELEKRGLEFCRFADDCNIFVKSQKAAERVMEKVSQFLENKLKLKVNREKSQVAKSEQVKFLGFTVVNGTIAIAHKALQTAMGKVKALTSRGTHQTLDTTLDKINRWYVGWSSYYSLTCYPSQLKKIEAHIRRRLRSRLVSQQKRKRQKGKRQLRPPPLANPRPPRLPAGLPFTSPLLPNCQGPIACPS